MMIIIIIIITIKRWWKENKGYKGHDVIPNRILTLDIQEHWHVTKSNSEQDKACFVYWSIQLSGN